MAESGAYLCVCVENAGSLQHAAGRLSDLHLNRAARAALLRAAGLQRGVISLAGAPVVLAGRGHQLAAVWHATAPTPQGEQCLAYAVSFFVPFLSVALLQLLHGAAAGLKWQVPAGLGYLISANQTHSLLVGSWPHSSPALPHPTSHPPSHSLPRPPLGPT